MEVLQQSPGRQNIKRLLLKQARQLKLTNLAFFYVWKDTMYESRLPEIRHLIRFQDIIPSLLTLRCGGSDCLLGGRHPELPQASLSGWF